MRSLDAEASKHLHSSHRARLASAVAARGGSVRAVAMTEDWCGDAVVNLPLVFAMGREEAGLTVRVFRRDMFPDLRGNYEAEGYDHIPVVSFFDASGSEIARFMERTEAADRRVAEWKAERPELADLEAERAEGSRRATLEMTRIYAELLPEMADWYRGDLWTLVADHLIGLIEE